MNPRVRKFLLVTAITILALALVVIITISPIAKYLLEKYDKTYTGREIKTDWVYVNPFTGYIHLNGLKLYEQESDSVFFSADGLSINVSLNKLFSGTYEISDLTLTKPKCIIIQNRKKFNFDDLLEKFKPKAQDSVKEPAHVNLLNVQVSDGEFYYREESIPVNYFIKRVDFQSSGMRWNVDTVEIKFAFFSGPGTGSVKGNSTLNIKSMDYRLEAVVNKFDLKIIEQYLKDLSNYGSFSATMDSHIKATGNLKDKESVSMNGAMAINDFHFGKNPHEDYMSFDKLALKIRGLSPKKHIYDYDSISIVHPYFKYERYDHLDNLQNMFGRKGSNIGKAKADSAKFNLIIEIADYVKVLARNFFKSDYRINRIAVYNANLVFNDYSLSEKFSIALNPLNVVADSINKSRERVGVFFKSGIKPYGNCFVNIRVNPKDSSDFTMEYQFEHIPSTLFNPYLVTYTSFPLDRGTIEFKGMWKVQNGIIQSSNHFLVIDPRTTERIHNKDTRWIPTPLIMSFVRERGNVINYSIPITGNLKNPKFHLGDVIRDIAQNIFVKPPATPYLLEVDNIETEIEKSLTLKWNIRQDKLLPEQEKFISRIAEFLQKDPDARLDIYPQEYVVREKEHILFFEAKKKYFLLVNNKQGRNFTSDDSLEVDHMSVKDSAFICYLDKQFKDSMLFTVQEKCSRFIGDDIVDSKLVQLVERRKKCFISYFEKVEDRVKIHPAENIIPYNGFSFYKIKYKGDLPEKLMDAYKKLNELDEEVPRKKYKHERKKNKGNIPDIAKVGVSP